MEKIILKIFTLLVTLNIMLLGNSVSELVSTTAVETVEVSLDSFGTLSIILLVVLSSLLGAYFLKDEFSSMLD